MIKLLTGEVIHAAYQRIAPDKMAWNSLPETWREHYTLVAKQLNVELGLCGSCGERPATGELREVAGEFLCALCHYTLFYPVHHE